MQKLAREISDLKIIEEQSDDIITMLEAVGNRQIELAVIDSDMEDIANQFVPSMRATLSLSDEQPIVWLLGETPNSELQARAGEFIERVQRDGTMARLEDRYFGHARRLDQADIVKFLGQIETTLPKLRKIFQGAQSLSGLDWRLDCRRGLSGIALGQQCNQPDRCARHHDADRRNGRPTECQQPA